MKSSVVVAKHPLHPMIVPIPIACFLLALIGDLAFTVTANPFWYLFSAWTMGFGIIGGLLAALPGLADYFTVVSRQAKRPATMHMILNLGIVATFAVNLAIRLFATPSSGAGWWFALALTVLGNAALLYSGWLGGELVYRHRIGIEEEPLEKARLRVTMSPEEVERASHRK